MVAVGVSDFAVAVAMSLDDALCEDDGEGDESQGIASQLLSALGRIHVNEAQGCREQAR